MFQFNLGKTAAEAFVLHMEKIPRGKVRVKSGSQNLELIISICLIDHVLEDLRKWDPTICKHCWIKMILNQVYNLLNSYKLILQQLCEVYM